jgi:signal transduction histidine kinase
VRPLRRYVRARLHRRIFLWFGASILLTGVLAAALIGVVGRSGGSWYGREVERARALTDHLFARAWSSPSERDALARTIADDLDISLALSSPDGSHIAEYGPPCRTSPMRVPVVKDGATVGHVAACWGPERREGGRRMWPFLPVILLGGALWAASGAIARRLSRPLGDLARVAQEIGAGKLSSRVPLDCDRHGEVGVVAEAMNDMAARIEKQMADQRELLAAVSHELRTPLARLRLLTEIARDTGTTDKTLDEIDREVMEIDALVGDLLASSRIDFAALTTRPLEAEEMAKRALERAGQPEDKLETSGGAGPGRVEADATLLGRALANLIDNATKHGGGVSAMRVEARGDVIAFEVDDQGPGFGPGDEERAFEPFYSRGRGGRDAGSLGLGLALVKRIAEAHKGRAYATNRPGGGARVGLEIPRSRAA